MRGMDLGLDLSALLPGRRPAAPEGEVARHIGEAELASLATAGATPLVPVVRISQRHHALARALAAGMTEADAAATAGYTQAHVSHLKASPAFRELLDLYRDQHDRIFRGTLERLQVLADDSIDVLQDRLERDPDAISVGQLLEIGKLALDRTGFGPQTKTEQTVRIDLAERLRAAQARAREAVIEGTFKEIAAE